MPLTLLKIAQIGHPVLRARAKLVEDPTAPEIQALVDDMLDTMLEARGVGLAAPQVYRSLRLVVLLPIVSRDAPPVEPLAVVNPELERMSGELEEDIEGCLSIPSLRGIVPRARRVGWRGLDRQGRPIEGEAEGLAARIFQHEVDHLDGILYPMRMPDLGLLAAAEELDHLKAELERRKA